MMASPSDRYQREQFASDRAYQFVCDLQDADRQRVVADAMHRYMRADTLQVGDAVPELRLQWLDGDGDGDVPLAARDNRPLVLFFGSYT